MSESLKEQPGKGSERYSAPDVVFATKGTFPGEVNIQWDAVEGAHSYILQMSKGKKKKWVQIDIVTEPFYNLTGLNNKTEHLFRVAAVYTDGQGKWSEVFRKKLE